MTKPEREWFEKLHNQKEMDKDVLLRPDYIGLWKSVIDKYSDKAHFIYELIQNADDACATFIKFDLQKDGLWVLHNGKERFSVTDPDDNTKRGHINSITSIGVSTKIDEQKIGKFGVGFKAVFAYTETPEIYDNFNFKIENYIVPTEIKSADYEHKTDETLFHFPFCKDRLQKSYDDILEKLRTLIYPTLFLSNLEEVSWKTETENGRYLKKIKQTELEGNISYEKIELLQEIGLKATNEILWLFKRYIKEDKNHPYSIGFFLNEEGKLRKKQQLEAFCFFPTKKDTGLNFIVHAPFLLNDSREGIKEDNWNKELLYKLAELSADSLLVLKGLNLIDDNIIDMIPYKQSMGLFSPFYEKIKQKFQTEELLPTKDGTFARKENAYWAEYTNIPVLFSNKQLVELTKQINAKWVFSSLGRNNDEKQKYIDDIVFGHLDVEKLLSYITPDFTQNQKFDWLHELYDFLGKRLKTYEKYVKNKAIFIDSEGQAISAFENEKLNLYFQAKSGYKTIHPALLENDNSKDFFIKFGIKKEPDLEGVINKLLNDNDDINEHFSTILEYYKKCKECLQADKINILIKDLENKKLFAENDMAKAGEIYYPTLDLRKYFETKPDTKFLDLERYYNFIEEKDRNILEEFLLKIGVAKYPRIIELKYPVLNEQQRKQVSFLRGTPKYQKYLDKKIDGCDKIIIKIKTEKEKGKSILLWEQLLNMIRDCNIFFERLKGEYEWIYYNQIEWQKANFDSSAIILLTQCEWLMNKKGEFDSANEIYIDDLSDDYDTTSKDAIRLIDFLKIKKRSLSENDNAAKSLKFKNAEEAEKAREFYSKFYSKYYDELEKRETKTVFPTSNSANPERRAEKIEHKYNNYEQRISETKEPSERATVPPKVPPPKNTKPYLREIYTNNDNQLICQICKEEMPFKKRDEEYYFEAIEIFSETNIIDKDKKMEEPYLALCPVCAAKYIYGGFVDDDQKNKIKREILNENIEANKNGNYEIPISLDYETKICFVAKHFMDLKTILKLSSPPHKPDRPNLVHGNGKTKEGTDVDINSDTTNSLISEKESFISNIDKQKTNVSGLFTDKRDGKKYRTVKIGNQTWMAENFAFKCEGSKCYAENYGRLYDWETAKKEVPSGWHLPSLAEWNVLMDAVGGEEVAGKKLKDKSGWNSGNGTDEFYFSALPGGHVRSGGIFYGVGDYGRWWSAIEKNSNNAYYWGMSYDSESAYRLDYDKSGLFSVRYLQDYPPLTEGKAVNKKEFAP